MRLTERLAACVRLFQNRRPRRDDGMTVMEIVVAMTIIGGVMASASLFFISGLRNTGGQSQRQAAVTLASEKLESVQSIPPSALISGRDCTAIYNFTHTSLATTLVANDVIASTVGGQATAGNCDTTVPMPTTEAVTHTEPAVVNGVSYTIETYIDVCWLAGNVTTGTCGPTNTGGTLTKLYRATVDVSYAPTSGLTCSGLATGRCDYVVSTLIDRSDDPTFNSNILVPTVTAVSPANGVLVGSTRSVTLTGTNFVNGVSVAIASTGGVVTAITNNTGTSLTFTLAAGTVGGTYTVTLLNPDGGTTTTSVKVNPQPTITGVSPNAVTVNSVTTMTLTGTGFQNGASIAVTTGTGTVANAAYGSPASMTVQFTANNTPGTRTFTLTNPDLGTATITFTVTTAPTITSVSPSSVGNGATKTLTITGTGFVSGATVVSSAGGSISSYTYVSSTSMTATFVASSVGTRSITVTNPDGGATSANVTVNAAPTLSSITPNLACSAGTQTLTFNGTGLVAGATVSDTGLDTFTGTTLGSGNSATIVVTRNGATAGNRTLTFTNPDGGSVTKTLTATNCSAPTISTVNPASGSAINEPLTITLTGSGFLQGASVTAKRGASAYGTVSNISVNSGGTSLSFTYSATTTNTSAIYTFTVTQDGDTASIAPTYTKIT